MPVTQIHHLEPTHGNVWLVTVLLPEQPFIHFRGIKSITGNEIAVTREIADDGVGLRQRAAIVENNDGHLPRRIHRQKLRRAGLAVRRIDLDPCIGTREIISHPLHFQAIAGSAVAVNFHCRRPTCRENPRQQLFSKVAKAMSGDQNL